MGAFENRYTRHMTHKRCAICKRPVETAFAPFCSKRCADVDLQRWFSGAYAIPGDADDDSQGVATGDTGGGDDVPGQPGRGHL